MIEEERSIEGGEAAPNQMGYQQHRRFSLHFWSAQEGGVLLQQLLTNVSGGVAEEEETRMNKKTRE